MIGKHKPETDTARYEKSETTWLSVVRAYQTCRRRYEDLLQRIGLTSSQFDALLAVRRIGENAQPKQIADALFVTRGNVTGLLERLRKRGWIATRRHPDDGRAQIIALTPSGKRAIDQARPLVQSFIREQMAPFDLTELKSTELLMERMQRHLEAIDLDEIHQESAVDESPRQATLI